MKLPKILAAAALTAAFVTPSVASAKTTTLRVASLAPKNSAWGKVFKIWAKAIKKKSNGKLDVKMYYNGVQGDEGAMVGKMKTGQLDGAALTSVGLSNVYQNVLVMGLPGISDSWDNLGKVRKAIQPEIEKGFEAKGFKILSWGDVGLVRQMSKGFAVRRPQDVKGKRPAVYPNEPLGPKVYSLIGNVVPVPTAVMEMLPKLRANQVNIINAPALAAEQLQWTPYLDHVSAEVTSTAIGATLFRKKAIDGIPADVKEHFNKINKKMDERNRGRIKKLDDQAYSRIKKKMKVVQQSKADRAEWEKILRKAVKQLSRGVYKRSLVDKAAAAVGVKVD